MCVGARVRADQEVLLVMEACLGCRCGPQMPWAAASSASSMSRYAHSEQCNARVPHGCPPTSDCVLWCTTWLTVTASASARVLPPAMYWISRVEQLLHVLIEIGILTGLQNVLNTRTVC